MTKKYCAVLLLLIIHFGNIFVKGQSTVGDCNSGEQDTVNGLSRFVKDPNLHSDDAWITLTRSIQSEFQNLKAQISNLEDRDERHEAYLKNSIEEIKSQVKTANNDTKVQIARFENHVERHNTYMNNSLQETRRHMQTENIDTKAQISRLENRIESHNTYMNSSLQENKRQMQTAINDTNIQIARLENRIESHNTYLTNSVEEIKRQLRTENMEMKSEFQELIQKLPNDASVALRKSIQSGFENLEAQIGRLENQVAQMKTENTDTKAQISRLENLMERHNTYMNNSVEEIKRQFRMENMEMKTEFQGLIQKLPSRLCPKGFNYSVGRFPKCYAVLSVRVNWTMAQTRCSQLNNNAQLTVISSSREQGAIAEMLQDYDCKQQNEEIFTNEFWIGARRSNANDCRLPIEWTSNSGTTIPMQYTNWTPGEPNCGSQREACASIDKDEGFKWNDLTCTWSACPLCEITIHA